jgi:hypothetical protein
MSNRPTFRTLRCAVSSLLLASVVVAFDSVAEPVLIGDRQAVFAAPEGDDRLPEILARAERDTPPIDGPSFRSPLVIDEIRVDGSALGRRQNWNNAPQNSLDVAQGLPGNFGNTPGQGDLFRNPLLRDTDNAGANPAVAPAAGSEQGRSAGAREPVNAAQAMLWEAVDNALKLIRDSVVDETDMVSMSIVGVDFSLTLSGGRATLLMNGSDLWPTLLNASLMEESRPVTTVSAAAALQERSIHSGPLTGGAASLPETPAEIPLGLDSKGDIASIMEKVREFVADPLTIIAAVGSLLIWLSFEISNSIREQRRWRRLRRRAARGARRGSPA